MSASIQLPGVEIHAPVIGNHAEMLTPEAVTFLADLASNIQSAPQGSPRNPMPQANAS